VDPTQTPLCKSSDWYVCGACDGWNQCYMKSNW
jgi:hypothetical protein